MYSLKIILLCSFLISSVLSDQPNVPLSNSNTTVLVHVLFRHGNRTPDRQSLFPNDPNNDNTYEPFGYSQLTTKGKKKMYELGKFLRTSYSTVIPEQYTPDVSYAITTNLKRTKMSLELVLAGLFPPLELDMFADGLNWQPIPFLVEQNEHLIAIPLVNCPMFVRQYYRYILSTVGQSEMESYRELFESLSELTGLDVTSPEQVLDIFETLESEKDYGLYLPAWTNDLLDSMEPAAALYFKFATATPGLKRLMNGGLLKKILDDSLAHQAGLLPKDRKISLYSAHDLHISTMLNVLGTNYTLVPPYGAAIVFEVHNVDGVYGIKIYLVEFTDDGEQLTFLNIPGCSTICELDKFAELMADNFPTEYDVCTYDGELM